MPDLADSLTIEEFGRRLREGGLTCVALVEMCLRRIEADGPRLNAFVRVMTDDARRQAEELDRELLAGRDRGPLHGVPVAIKDLVDVKDLPTTAASRVREGHRAAADAPVIAHLRQAGAILIGKANLDEFAFGTTSENSAFGPVRNPHDTSRSPGGSSGGSAVSVAVGMALGALGTDTGGSIRIPAAACGTVGLKPTYGEVSTEGVVPLSRTLDHVGTFARSVTDAWLLHRVFSGTSKPGQLTSRESGTLRLGIPREYFCDVLDADVRARFENALHALRDEGVTMTEVRIPQASKTSAVYLHIHASEGAAYHARTLDTVPERYMPQVRLRLEVGRYVTAGDYLLARTAQQALRREVDAALAGCDALVLPTLPIPAPPIGAESIVVNGATEPVRALMLRNTQLFNVSGHPAISIPCGTTPSGLPCGLQLVGRRFQTESLCEIAAACEMVLKRSAG